LQTKLDKVASLSGDNKKLANQELKIALEKGLITKPQRDLLARAISDSANTDVAVLKERLNRYAQAYLRADADGNGKVSNAEARAAQEAVLAWSRAANSINPVVPKAKVDALFAKVVTTTHTKRNGTKVEVPEMSINSLLLKINKLLE
ncbi:MAG: hypothetical protein JNG84_01845, partial [Archangium sp.]|nr:hypothetical protein [Archangium sp.]